MDERRKAFEALRELLVSSGVGSRREPIASIVWPSCSASARRNSAATQSADRQARALAFATHPDRSRGSFPMTDLSTTKPEQSKYDRLIAAAREVAPAVTIVAHPCDETSLQGALDAENRLIVPVLVEPAARIQTVAAENGLDLKEHEIVDVPNSHAAAAKAVVLVREGKGEFLMKGSLHTDELMRDVTAPATGLRTERRVSHIFVMDVPDHADTLFITDAAINISPDLDVKRDIVQNAIVLWTTVGLGQPRVVILSAARWRVTQVAA
jgi:phosphate acetyltransferase